MARMTDEDLIALTDAELQDAVGFSGATGQLEAKRRKNLAYFMAEATGDLAPPEVDGRSSVVDTTVRDTILGMEAPLIKTFCGTENVVELSETTADDEEKAKQATDYLNYLLRKKNAGYSIVTTWIRDALVQKVGFVKVWWDASEIESKEEYRGQTDVQLAMLLDDPEIELIDQRSYPDPEAEKAKAKQLEQMYAQLQQMQQAAMQSVDDQQAWAPFQQAQAQYKEFAAQPVPQLFDVTAKRKKTGGRLVIDNVPPEEVRVKRGTKSLATVSFIGHKLRRTIGQLKASGYKNVDDIKDDGEGDDMSGEALARREYEDAPISQRDPVDESMREVWITECYVKCDYDGNGLQSWRKVVRCGKTLLENEETDDHPFVAWCPVPLPHRLFGLCPADLAEQPQRTKTYLKRGLMDNIQLQVNGRTYAMEGQVNLDDLLDSRPGGIVRVQRADAVGRLDQGLSDMAGAMALMETVEQDAEEATGWTRQSQGGNGMPLDATATQANIVTNRADSRVEIIARQFAETGYTDLFKRMLKLVCQHQNKADHVKLSGKWVDVDPREWTNQFDMTINVGLGTGNKDQLVQHLNVLIALIKECLAIGVAVPANLYRAAVKLAEALGFKSGDQFFKDPSAPPNPNDPPPPPPPPDPAIVKAQLDAQTKQAQLQFEREKVQIQMQAELQKAQMMAEAQMQVDQNRQQLEAEQQAMRMQQQAELDQRQAEFRHAEQMAKIELEREKLTLERYKIDMQNDAKIVAAQIAAQQQNDASLQAAEDQANQDMSQ